LGFKKLQVNVPAAKPAVRLAGRPVSATFTREGGLTTLEFARPIVINAGQSCAVG
jgi:hypothetical protein